MSISTNVHGVVDFRVKGQHYGSGHTLHVTARLSNGETHEATYFVDRANVSLDERANAGYLARKLRDAIDASGLLRPGPRRMVMGDLL